MFDDFDSLVSVSQPKDCLRIVPGPRIYTDLRRKFDQIAMIQNKNISKLVSQPLKKSELKLALENKENRQPSLLASVLSELASKKNSSRNVLRTKGTP